MMSNSMTFVLLNESVDNLLDSDDMCSSMIRFSENPMRVQSAMLHNNIKWP